MFNQWIRMLAVEEGGSKKAMDPAEVLEAEVISRQKTMIEAMARGDSVVQKFFNDATVFITGGSGFLGKQLVEKLIRACNVKKIYLLLRPKKGKKIEERLQNILQDPVYSNLLIMQPSFAEKLVCVLGDVAEINLGLCDRDWKMVANEVDVIFHVSATTRFDESLKVATLINVKGTREAIKLGKECKKLRSFVYVSTAYSHATAEKRGKAVLEKFYPTPVQPDALIGLVESVDCRKLERMTPKLIEGWPNTYTFTKAVAEEVVRAMAGDLPVCVVRPSVVISSYYEPTPGWLDMSCVNSASGFLVGSGLGLLHVMQTIPSTEISLVPVDYVNNALIAAAWEVGTRQRNAEKETTIYNVVMSEENKLNSEMLRVYCLKLKEDLAMPSAVWVAYAFCVQNYYSFLLLTVILHLVPACFGDALLVLFGKERRFLKLYKKIFKLSVSLSYFQNNTYHLNGRNTQNLYEKLSSADKKIFFFNMKSINWFEFCKVWCIGVRKYIVKDGLRNTDLGIRKQFWFKYLNYIVLALYACVFWFVMSNSFHLICKLKCLF